MPGHLSTFPLNFVVVAFVLRFFFSCLFFRRIFRYEWALS